MIATEKPSNLILDTMQNNELRLLNYPVKNQGSCINQFLYMVSDNEINIGDWYIDDSNTVRQSITSDKDYWAVRKDYKKIEATSDSSLGLEEVGKAGYSVDEFYPILNKITKEFIKSYVKAKGNITECYVSTT